MSTAAVQKSQTTPHQLNPSENTATKGAPTLFTQFQEKVKWVWDVTVQHVKTAAEAIKNLIQRVVHAVRSYFSPQPVLKEPVKETAKTEKAVPKNQPKAISKTEPQQQQQPIQEQEIPVERGPIHEPLEHKVAAEQPKPPATPRKDSPKEEPKGFFNFLTSWW